MKILGYVEFLIRILTSRLERGPKANAIKINAGIHTGNLMAGVIKEAIPRYSIIGQAFFKAKQVQKRASGEECKSHQIFVGWNSFKILTMNFRRENSDQLRDEGPARCQERIRLQGEANIEGDCWCTVMV